MRKRNLLFMLIGGALLVGGLLSLFYPFPRPTPSISYYHWANTYQNHPEFNTNYKPERLYLKLMDIGVHGNQVNVIRTRLEGKPTLPVTAVVFIDPRVFFQRSAEELEKLITQAIPATQYPKIQLDCDWTESTRIRYFSFLKQLSKTYHEISVTLRLHQIKYAKRTGTPPADRAVLMYYNMSDVKDIKIENYILDNKVGKQYLQRKYFADYALPIDLALPLYQQTRVIRQQKLVQLIPTTDINSEKTKPASNPNHFIVTQAHYWNGYYLYKGDILARDTVDMDDLHKATALLSPLFLPREIIFYTLQDAQRFSYEKLQSLSTDFK